MISLEILDMVGYISTFTLGVICFISSRNGKRSSVILFWTGLAFFHITLARILSVFEVLTLAESRLMIGMFYPFVLIAILLDWGVKLPLTPKHDN